MKFLPFVQERDGCGFMIDVILLYFFFIFTTNIRKIGVKHFAEVVPQNFHN